MIVVTGLRRSGTSMLMQALKKAGFEIAGHKFALDSTPRQIEANPNGFWEVGRITKDTGLTDTINGEVIKIMFEVLSFSKPELIDKAIVIFRQPTRAIFSLMEHNQIEYESIFMAKQALDSVDSIFYLLKNKIDFKIVIYEEILENPREQMKDICEFLGKGNWKKAAKTVDKKLNRSSEALGLPYMHLLEDIYKFAKEGNVNAIVNLGQSIELTMNKLIKDYDRGKIKVKV